MPSSGRDMYCRRRGCCAATYHTTRIDPRGTPRTANTTHRGRRHRVGPPDTDPVGDGLHKSVCAANARHEVNVRTYPSAGQTS